MEEDLKNLFKILWELLCNIYESPKRDLILDKINFDVFYQLVQQQFSVVKVLFLSADNLVTQNTNFFEDIPFTAKCFIKPVIVCSNVERIFRCATIVTQDCLQDKLLEQFIKYKKPILFLYDAKHYQISEEDNKLLSKFNLLNSIQFQQNHKQTWSLIVQNVCHLNVMQIHNKRTNGYYSITKLISFMIVLLFIQSQIDIQIFGFNTD